MNLKARAVFLGMGIVLLLLTIPAPLRAQAASATLSGTVTGPSGAAVPNAKISITSAATGQSTEAENSAAGIYTLSNLTPGDYVISVSADGFDTKIVKVTVTEGAKQTLDLALTPSPGTGAAPPPSLADLGFPADQTQGNAKDQARLDKRSHMLKMHQRYGLITLGLLAATVASSSFAGGRHPSAVGRDVHSAFGAATADMYFMTAYYAIRAPKIPGTATRGPIRFHKAMAWIHGPGMILTPILGAMAFAQERRGERVHGIAKAHGAVAAVTYTAFGLAVLSVSFKF